VAERDRLTRELTDARDAVGIVRSGNADSLPAKTAARLRVWLLAAEMLVQDAQAALEVQARANGTGGR
jgi:hypothetical protein